jgi:hypothetical protein
MTDNQLIQFMAAQLDAASEASGWNYPVLQKNNPTLEGIPAAPAIFFEKLFDHAYGWPIDSFTYNEPPVDNFSDNSMQLYETTFQISALVIQDPEDLTLPTASDVANYIKMWLTHPVTLQTFRSQNVGLLRVTQIRNPYFEDDRHRFEAHPNFDLVLTHDNTLTLTVPAANRAVPAPSNDPTITGTGVFPVPDAAGQTVP